MPPPFLRRLPPLPCMALPPTKPVQLRTCPVTAEISPFLGLPAFLVMDQTKVRPTLPGQCLGMARHPPLHRAPAVVDSHPKEVFKVDTMLKATEVWACLVTHLGMAKTRIRPVDGDNNAVAPTPVPAAAATAISNYFLSFGKSRSLRFPTFSSLLILWSSRPVVRSNVSISTTAAPFRVWIRIDRVTLMYHSLVGWEKFETPHAVTVFMALASEKYCWVASVDSKERSGFTRVRS